MTGTRVAKYNQLVCIASVLSKTVRPLLTGYIKTSRKYKVWKQKTLNVYLKPEICSLR